MKTGQYDAIGERKNAKRITRHPLYQRLRERTERVQRETEQVRRDNKNLSETVSGHLRTIELLRSEVAELKKDKAA